MKIFGIRKKIIKIDVDEVCSEVFITYQQILFGLVLFSWEHGFLLCHGDTHWMRYGTSKDVSKRTTKFLNTILDKYKFELKQHEQKTKDSYHWARQAWQG